MYRLDNDMEKLEGPRKIDRERWKPHTFLFRNVSNAILMEKLKPTVKEMHRSAVERKQFSEHLSKFVGKN